MSALKLERPPRINQFAVFMRHCFKHSKSNLISLMTRHEYKSGSLTFNKAVKHLYIYFCQLAATNFDIS